MTAADLSSTRIALHAVAELLLAGPQYAETGTIKLRATSEGFATTKAAPVVQVVGSLLLRGEQSTRIDGRTIAELGSELGLRPRELTDVYSSGSGQDVDSPVLASPDAATEVCLAFDLGHAALATFAPDETAILWPEHFDVSISLDEVNYGVSPGDTGIEVPYAYVGPHTAREGAFWNASFGASRLISDLGDAASIVAFFEEGQVLARG